MPTVAKAYSFLASVDKRVDCVSSTGETVQTQSKQALPSYAAVVGSSENVSQRRRDSAAPRHGRQVQRQVIIIVIIDDNR